MLLKIKKIISLGAALIFVAAWFAYGNLQNSYVGYPREPMPETGKIVPHPVKGGTVYITEDQSRFLYLLGWVQMISGIVAVLIILIHWGDPFRSAARKK
jgi:hypothetical protein